MFVLNREIDYRKIKHGQARFKKDQLHYAQELIKAVPSPLFIKDSSLNYICCNEAFLDLLEVTEDMVIGKRNLDIDSTYIDKIDRELIEQGGAIEYEALITSKLGKERHCVITKSQLLDYDDQALGIVGIIRDITEEKKQSLRVQRLMVLKDAMIEVTHAIMDNWSEQVLFDLILAKGVEVIKNSDHGSVLMRGKDDMFSPVAWIGYTDEAMESFSVHLHDTFNWLATNGHEEKSVIINDIRPFMEKDLPDIAETEDEAVIKASLCSPIIVDGQVVGLMNMDSSMIDAFTDVDMELVDYMSQNIEIALTKRSLYDKVLYLSQHDELTGLLNRRYFEDLAHQMVTQAERYDEEFCLVVFDINGLKQINDTFGHPMGDAYIQEFAKALKGIFRDSDLLGRYGGDEFVGMFKSMECEMVKSRILEVIETLKGNPIEAGLDKIFISFSYGVACYPNDGNTYEKLVSVADGLMYEYKKKWKS